MPRRTDVIVDSLPLDKSFIVKNPYGHMNLNEPRIQYITPSDISWLVVSFRLLCLLLLREFVKLAYQQWEMVEPSI